MNHGYGLSGEGESRVILYQLQGSDTGRVVVLAKVMRMKRI